VSEYFDKLDKLEKQIKEETDANAKGQLNSQVSRNTTRSSNGRGIHNEASDTSNASGSWVRSMGSRRLSKETRTVNSDERRNKVMIPARGIFQDYEDINKENIPTVDKIWKFLPKIVKIILNTRTNTVRLMDKAGIPRETDDRGKVPEIKTPAAQ
jgi:hypothetical protein